MPFKSPGDPVVGADETIYLTQFDVLYALNADGSTKWKHGTEQNEHYASTVTISADGTLYYTSADGLHVVNPDGSLKRAGPEHSASSRTIDGNGTHYFSHFVSGSTVELRSEDPDGTLRWAVVGGYADAVADPALDEDGTVYFGDCEGAVRAVNPNGTTKWTWRSEVHDNLPVCAYNLATTSGQGGRIYVTSRKKLYALTP